MERSPLVSVEIDQIHKTHTVLGHRRRITMCQSKLIMRAANVITLRLETYEPFLMKCSSRISSSTVSSKTNTGNPHFDCRQHLAVEDFLCNSRPRIYVDGQPPSHRTTSWAARPGEVRCIGNVHANFNSIVMKFAYKVLTFFAKSKGSLPNQFLRPRPFPLPLVGLPTQNGSSASLFPVSAAPIVPLVVSIEA